MLGLCDSLGLGFKTSGASISSYTFYRASRSGGYFTFVPVVTVCLNGFLSNEHFVTCRTVLTFGQTCFGTSRSNSLVGYFGMSLCGIYQITFVSNLCPLAINVGIYVVTVVAGVMSDSTCSGTIGSNCSNEVHTFFVGSVVANYHCSTATVTCVVAIIVFVAEGIDNFGIGVVTICASEGLQTILGTSCRIGDFFAVIMACCFDCFLSGDNSLANGTLNAIG